MGSRSSPDKPAANNFLLVGFSAVKKGQQDSDLFGEPLGENVMAELPASMDAPASEAIATTGLFLNIASVIAIAVSIASWSADQALVAAVAVIAAFCTFVGSLVCFGKQAQEGETPADRLGIKVG